MGTGWGGQGRRCIGGSRSLVVEGAKKVVQLVVWMVVVMVVLKQRGRMFCKLGITMKGLLFVKGRSTMR